VQLIGIIRIIEAIKDMGSLMILISFCYFLEYVSVS